MKRKSFFKTNLDKNGKDWDDILHVNPLLKEKGTLMFYNPLNEKISRKINIPLNYTVLLKLQCLPKSGLQKMTIRSGRITILNLW